MCKEHPSWPTARSCLMELILQRSGATLLDFTKLRPRPSDVRCNFSSLKRDNSSFLKDMLELLLTSDFVTHLNQVRFSVSAKRKPLKLDKNFISWKSETLLQARPSSERLQKSNSLLMLKVTSQSSCKSLISMVLFSSLLNLATYTSMNSLKQHLSTESESLTNLFLFQLKTLRPQE